MKTLTIKTKIANLDQIKALELLGYKVIVWIC